MPIVGPIVRNLGLEEWHAGITVTLGAVAWIFFARYWGEKSDSVGRKPILVITVLGIAISYLSLAVFVDFALDNPPMLIVSLIVLILTRGLVSIFYAAISPVSAAFIADKVESANRAPNMAKLGAANGMGMVIGPIAGGMLAVYGLQMPLYTFAVLPFIAAVVLYFKLERSPKLKVEKKVSPKFFDRRLLLPSSATFLAMFGFMSINTCLGFYVLDIYALGDTDAAKVAGYILAIIGVFLIMAQIVVSKLKHIHEYRYLKFGILLSALGVIGLGYTHILSMSLFFGAIYGLGMGFMFPSLMTITANSVEQHEQGYAAGTVDSTKGLGMIFAPVLSTIFYSISPTLPFLISGILLVVLFVSLLGQNDLS